MYVADMDYETALYWEESLEAALVIATGAEREHLQWDLQDVREHIKHVVGQPI